VMSPSQIRFLDPDAVIIADSQRAEEICGTLRSLLERGISLIRLDGHSEQKPAETKKTDLLQEKNDNYDSRRIPL